MDSSWAVVCSLMLVTPLFRSHVGINYTWCILVSNQRSDFFTQRSFCISYLPVKFWFASFISHANIVYHAMSRCQDILAIKKEKVCTIYAKHHLIIGCSSDNWLDMFAGCILFILFHIFYILYIRISIFPISFIYLYQVLCTIKFCCIFVANNTVNGYNS